MKPRGKPIKWSPEIAYVVGLITTDGSLSKDGRHIDFTSKDIQLLKTFKRCLGIKNKITKKLSGAGKLCSRIQFGNVIFYKWLMKIGLMSHKTGRLTTLEIPNQYFFDFLRGHLDGDGSIKRYMDSVYPNSERLYIYFNSTSPKHLKWLRRRIKSLIKIKGFVKKGKKGDFSLVFAKRDSLKLLPCLYYLTNIPCLKRKYKIIKDLL
jgi:hypothetical protein